jgi:hypothetical protein
VLAHQDGHLELLAAGRERELWVELGDEERIVVGQGRDEVDVDGEVGVFSVAGGAGATIAPEFLVEEEVGAPGD